MAGDYSRRSAVTFDPMSPTPWTGDALALADDLRRSVRGEVRFDDGARALYATDASNYRQVPIGVVVPQDTDDLVAAVAACRRHRAPIVQRGAGTSLAGQCCNVAVVIDGSRNLRGVLALDPEARTARVRPGTVLDDLRREAGRHGLTFGPDPATHAWCTVGGMIGNNSCGVHSVTAGRTSDNVEELEVLPYAGLRLRVGATPARPPPQPAGRAGAASWGPSRPPAAPTAKPSPSCRRERPGCWWRSAATAWRKQPDEPAS